MIAQRKRVSQWLMVGQWLGIVGVLLLIAHRNRVYLWSVLPDYVWRDSFQTSVFIEFRGIVIFIADYPLWILMGATLLRLAVDSFYRQQLARNAGFIWERYGGKWWLALAVWMGMGIFWAEIPELVRYSTLHLLLALAFALIIADWSTRYPARYLIIGLLLGALVQGGLAIAQAIHRGPVGLDWLGEGDYWWYSYDLRENLPNERDVSTIRSTGLSVNPNNLAGYLMVAFFGIWWLVRQLHGKARLALLGAMLITLSGLLTTVSRAAILGTAVAGGTVWLLLPKLWQGKTTRYTMLGTALLFLVGVYAMRGVLWSRFGSLVDGTSSGEFLGRDFLWEDTQPILQAHWLTGVGANNLPMNIAKNNPQKPFIALPVHNAYLQIVAELGIVGLSLVGLGIFMAVRHIRRNNALLWGGALLGIGVVSLFDYYFWGDYPSRLLLFGVLGFLWGELLAQQGQTPQGDGTRIP